MNLDNPIRMVRELKGAPLSILFALSVVHQRVSQTWLEGVTGYTDKPVSSALSYLEEVGLADHTYAGWKLTGKAKQLPLPVEELEPEGPEDPEPEINSDDSCQGRNNSDSIITINTESIKEEEVSSNNNKGSRKNSDSGVLEALTRAGIMGRKRESLAKIATVTVDSVERWEAELKRRKRDKYSPGLLISVLESGDPAPVAPVKKDNRGWLIEHGLMCAVCGSPIQDCECEVEE